MLRITELLGATRNRQRQALLKQNPDLAAQLAEHFADLDTVELWRQRLSPDNACVDTDVYRTIAKTNSFPDVPVMAFSDSAIPADQRSGISPFGRYRVESVLGAGAMGEVYRALDTKLQRPVALKVPKREQNSNAELMGRFLEEARMSAKLRHRNICPVFDTGTIDGCNYITMEFVTGHPLSSYIQPDKQLPQRAVTHLVRKLAYALAEAHGAKVIHRDLKPANIMVDHKKEPVIMDFGLARQIGRGEEERLTHAGTVLGTPAYMSPEQTFGETGPASDMYSLGVIFYELLTGRLPFTGSLTSVLVQIVADEPPEPSELRPDLDPRLREICLKMMAKRIEDRYDSMAEVATTLTGYLKSSSESTAGEAASTNQDDEALAQLFNSTTGNELPVQAATLDVKPPPTPVPCPAGPRFGHFRESIGQAWRKVPPAVRWTGSAAASVTLSAVLAIVFLLQGDNVTVQVKIDQQLLADGAVTLVIAGQEMEIGGLGETIKLKPGPHYFEVLRGDSRIKADEFNVVKNGENVLEISIVDAIPFGDDAASPSMLVHTFAGHVAPVHCAAFSPDGRRVLSGTTKGGSLCLWDVESGELIRCYQTPAKWCTSIVFLPGGERAAFANSPKALIHVLDLALGEIVHTIQQGRTGQATRLTLGNKGTQLIAVSRGAVQA